MNFSYLLFTSCFLVPTLVFSQKIDNTVSFRSPGADKYFRFNYDNDFFAANDYYYTQGYSFEIGGLGKHPLSKLLLGFSDSSANYGLALEHFGFTPTSIGHNEILKDDRPFAASLILKSFMVSRARNDKMQLSSLFSLGVIGPLAFGGDMQKTIHRWIGDEEPKGWQYQIRNDFVLNYELNAEWTYHNGKYSSLSPVINLRAGTLNTRMQTGFIFTAGKYNAATDQKRLKKKLQVFAYTQPLINLIAYDATLQGGLFSDSPYTIRTPDIIRVNFQNNFGVVLKSGKVYFEYSRSVLGKEFKTGKAHQWGGFRTGFKI